MDRLTKVIDGSVVFPSELVGVTLTPGNDTMHELLTRLAAYEDAGLEPEEIKSLVDNWNLYGGEYGIETAFEKLAEYQNADNDGRLVVLPCKKLFSVGPRDCEGCPKSKGPDSVCEELEDLYNGRHLKYSKNQDWEFMKKNCPREICEEDHPTTAQVEAARDGNPGADGGVEYYFTREAAEAALEEEINETNLI